jgi:radical SAM superfamily enzyme YgiQ (UPF0313 family)
VKNQRRVLCVFPSYVPAFGTFQHAYRLMYGVKAFMPPQGLLLIAAYMPESWPVRFVDENIAAASEADFAWADVVLVTGMHIQAEEIRDIQRRARAAGKVTVLGGPSVSASPEMYPDYDYLHVGEMGDATDAIVAALDASVAPPAQQSVCRTRERLPLTDFPLPAYDRIPFGRYLLGTMQFSSGCPYLCEFCDIPGLYGRQPRMKTPQQIVAELAPGRMAETARLSGDVRLRGDAQHREADRHPGADAGSVLHRHVRRHRDAGGRCARRHPQRAQQRRADARLDQDAEQLRHRGHVRHHSRARYRRPRHREAAEGLH